MFTFPTNWNRLIVGCCVALAIAACGHHNTGQASAGPANLKVDSLIVSLDDMRRLTGVPGLEQMSELGAEPPTGSYDQQVPLQCRATYYMSVAFGDTWKQFKGLDFTDTSGGSGSDVLQAVAIYADDNAARGAFDQLAANLRRCASLHRDTYQFTVNEQNPSNFALCYDQCRTLYRVKDSVVIEVAADEFHDTATVAQTVMQAITDRIPGR